MASPAPFAWRLPWLLFAACMALFLLGPPLFLYGSVWSEEGFARLPAEEPADRRRLAALLGATLRLTVGATVLATGLGLVVAAGIHRARGLRRRLLETLYPIPLLLPPAVVAISWTHLLGRRGLAAEAWYLLAGSQNLPFSIYGEAGSAAVLALCWFPLVTMSVLVGLRAVGAQALHSARVYASPWRRTLAISLPLLLPYLSAGAAFTAWMVLGDFDVPSVFLRNAYPLEIFAAFQVNPEMALALARAWPHLALSAGVLLARGALLRGRGAATIDTRWRPEALERPGEAGSGGPWPERLSWAILTLAVLVPVCSLLHQTGSGSTLREAWVTAAPQILNTFRTALAAAALIVLLGLPYACLLARASPPLRGLLGLLAILPLALPGTLHGLAWTALLLKGEPGRALLASPYVISLAAAARFFPFGVFVLGAVLEGLSRGLFDAGACAGAGPLRRAWRIGLPLAYPGLAAAFALGFALSAGELGAAILLNPPGYSTLPVRISSLLHFGKDQLLAGLCLTQIFVVLVPYLIAAVLARRALEVRLG